MELHDLTRSVMLFLRQPLASAEPRAPTLSYSASSALRFGATSQAIPMLMM
jgi:hypothetical protein